MLLFSSMEGLSSHWLIIIILIPSLLLVVSLIYLSRLYHQLKQTDSGRSTLFELLKEQQKQQFEQQLKGMATIQDSIRMGMKDVREQIAYTLKQQSDTVNQSIDKLTLATQERLKEISGQVDKKLTEGFEKTTATF